MKNKKNSKGMRYPALNTLISKANNKYELVLATSKRAREIISGSAPLIPVTINNPISIATEEIAEDIVKLKNPVVEEERLERERRSAAFDLSDLEVDTMEFGQSAPLEEEPEEDDIFESDFYTDLIEDNEVQQALDNSDEEPVPEERLEDELKLKTEPVDSSDLDLSPLPVTEENAELAFDADIETQAEADDANETLHPSESDSEPIIEAESEFEEETQNNLENNDTTGVE